jgi:glycerol-3-phosphate dehydrogenase (NAD(P)+)
MEDIKNISILGSTSWGITLSNILVKNVDNVTILTRDLNEEKRINDERLIKRGKIYKLDNKIKISSNYEKIIEESQIIILAVPSSSIKKNIGRINKFLTIEKIVISAIKGLEQESKKTISQYLFDNTKLKQNNIGVISGPNISSEIYDGLPATTVIGIDKKNEEKIRKIFNSDKFRAYSSNDIIGIEVGGILKNIFAIGAGIIQEYKLGTNSMAAYITRSLNEMKNIITFFGGNEKTIFGNSGLGDLITTCFNPNSRNNQLGSLLARGVDLETAKENITGIIEGINSTRIIKNILLEEKIKAPIINEIYKVLFNGKNPKVGINDLLSRDDSKE